MTDINMSDIRRLDGNLLLVFRELLRRRRTTEAARRLGLTQSTVSHALTRLRDVFDDPLFLRRPHGLEPTARALALGPRIEALIELMGEALSRDTEFDPARSERRFSFSAPEWVTATLGPPLMRRLKAAAPGVSIHARVLANQFNALRKGEIDLVLGQMQADGGGLTTELLYEDVYCVVARADHPHIRGRIGLRAYAETGHAWQGPPEEGFGSDWTLPAGVATDAVVSNWQLAVSLVAASDSLGSVPRRLALQMAEVMPLQVLDSPFAEAAKAPPTYLVSRTESRDSAVDWFLDQVRAVARGEAPPA